jgi:hypothetical protein
MKDAAFQLLFRRAMDLAAEVGSWADPRFDWVKCYIASIISLAAYSEVPGFELDEATRAKLIPCDLYHRLYAAGQISSARQALLSVSDNQQVRVIVRRELVAVVAKLQDVLFVTFRGTTPCAADLIADAKAWKTRVAWTSALELEFHRGFHQAVQQGFLDVVDAIEELGGSGELPLYVTGHSLGGAMTAIFTLLVRRPHGGKPYPRVTAHYIFGTPRYCTDAALRLGQFPHQVCNEFDGIPSVPPRTWGYVDIPGALVLRADGSLAPELDRGDLFLAWREGVEADLRIAEHRLEQYVTRCEVNARLARPKLRGFAY